MKLEAALAGVGVEALKARYFGQRVLVLSRQKSNPFEGLITPEELEIRLNDGVASDTALAVIGPDGRKLAMDELHQVQPVAGWSRAFVRKSRLAEQLASGASIVLHNMSHLNPGVAELIADIEATFPGMSADAHLYISPRASASGYQVHKDLPQHKLYLQVLGSTDWTVYRGTDPRRSMSVEEASSALEVDIQVTLTPGSLLYLPPGVFHRAENPAGPRISLSIPFNETPGTFAVDRTHVPLARYFRDRKEGE